MNRESQMAMARVPGTDGAGPQWSVDERSESTRNGGPAPSAALREGGSIPDPEVSEKPRRRRFSAAYKARIVQAADACTEPGRIGALLRREGIYSSQLSTWRRLYHAGALSSLRDDKRGRKPSRHPLEEENERLRKQLARTEKRLQQAETIIDIQKKVAQMLGIPLKHVEEEENA
jgi:transposase